MPLPSAATADAVRAADQAFFDALTSGDADTLQRLLTDDFIIIDVMTGAEVPGTHLIAAVASRQVTFDRIDLLSSGVRLYGEGTAAIVNGRTRMAGTFEGNPFTAHSRYTHVFVAHEHNWLLANAQGTPILGES